MLRMTVNDNAAGAKSYYTDGLSREDYYSEGQEIAGVWQGRGAEKLGLVGRVEKSEFDALCDNRHPQSGGNLTARTKDNRRVGYDLNFHAPKSVSILYAMTGDRRIMDAFQRAVRETMQELEHDAKCRVRKKGQRGDRTTGNLVWAEFVHLTARPVGGIPDPHLHAHAFTFNATWDQEEGAWKAGEFGTIKKRAPYFEAAFHARLAGQLAREGFAIERRSKGWELGGIPRSTVEKFSRRTEVIERAAARRGIRSNRDKDRLGAATREKKVKSLTAAELKTEWANRLTPAERKAIGAVGKEPLGQSRMSSREALHEAMTHVFERASVVTEDRLMEAALRRGVGSVTVEGVREQVRQTNLIRGERAGEKLATTREVLREEEELVALARDARGTCKPLVVGEWSPTNDKLNDEQRGAVEHLLRSMDRVMAVRGGAGVGKTSLMKEAVAAIKKGGREVLAFAPSAEASRGLLRDEGFGDAETVARLLVDKQLQAKAKGQVIWIDEAGLLGVGAMKKVFEVAREQGARVILTGDTRQHTAVERGDAMRLLETSGALVPADVRKVQRQRGTYKEAVESISRGDLADGMARLDAMGAIIEVERAERYDRIADDYVRLTGAGKNVLAVSPTHREGADVTSKVRERLRAAGRLRGGDKRFATFDNLGWTEAQRRDGAMYEAGHTVRFHQHAKGFRRGERVTVVEVDAEGNVTVEKAGGERSQLPLSEAKRFQVYERDTCDVAVGDRLRITENGMARDGSRLFNGATYDVKSFTDDGGIVLSNGKVLDAGFGAFVHGYCATSHSSQGKTVDYVLIAESSDSWGAASAEQFYVSVSRGREGVTIYTDDREVLRSMASKSSARPSAMSLVEGEAEKPAPKKAPQLAHWQERALDLARKSILARALASRVVGRVIDKVATLGNTKKRDDRGFEYERERDR